MKSLCAYRKPSDLPISRRLKGFAGKCLIASRPDMAASIKAAPFRQAWPALGKLIRNGHLVHAVAEKDHATIRDFLIDYWSSPASDEFYTGLSHRYETLFLKYHAAIVEETVKAVRGSAGNFQQLVEIGVGDGKVLEHFSQHLPEIPEFHGLDINAVRIDDNRRIYRGRNSMSFHHADARQWLKENLLPGSVIIANGGVLEYFTRGELESLFGHLARSAAPVVVAITESVAADHDMDNEPDTFPYGLELSLSHNYLALLRNAGFTIRFVHDRLTTPEESEIVARWLQVVATI